MAEDELDAEVEAHREPAGPDPLPADPRGDHPALHSRRAADPDRRPRRFLAHRRVDDLLPGPNPDEEGAPHRVDPRSHLPRVEVVEARICGVALRARPAEDRIRGELGERAPVPAHAEARMEASVTLNVDQPWDADDPEVHAHPEPSRIVGPALLRAHRR